MAGRALTITYLADAKSVLATQSQIDAGHSKMEGTTSKVGGVFKSTFGSVIPLAGAAAAAAVVKFGTDSVKAAIESENAMAQTEARIKSTGGAANLTAEDVVGLAGQMRDLSGVDDEVIQSSENLLLTFTNVRNEVGKGNDIFNQATEGILDMATGMNKGAIPSAEQLQSATVQLGKALNDPIAGMSALSRVGVQFTESQKATIQALVESGDLMGAQKVILAELETQFGGSAKAAGDTFAGSLAKVQSRIGDLQEEIGQKLLPVIEQFLEGVNEAVEHPLPAVLGPLGAFADAVQNLGTNLDDVLPQLRDTAEATVELGQQTATDALPAIEDFVPWLFREGEAAREAAREIRGLTDAQRENRIETLALTDSFIGIISEAKDFAEAQREVNRLQQAGKQDTKAYDEAVLDALESQISLKDAVLSYGLELHESGKNQQQVNRELREAGAAAGLTKGEVRELIAEIRALIRAGEDWDGREFRATLTATPNFPPGFVPRYQHGGIVTRPTLAMIGEAGPEAVVPLTGPRRGGLGGTSVNVTIGTVVGPGGVAEVADIIRRELQKTGIRNVTAGIS